MPLYKYIKNFLRISDSTEEKFRFLGIGIVIGGIICVFILYGFNFEISEIEVGPIKFGKPDQISSETQAAPISLVKLTSMPNTKKEMVFSETVPIETKISEKDNMVMVYVPKGEFLMGSDSGNPDERPAHSVFLNAFWIDQTEVTNRMYALCVSYGSCVPPSKNSSNTRENYYNNFAYENFPVMFVSWEQASDYCNWAGKRLPSEAEWEKAARGNDGRKYPWGNEDPQEALLNYNRLVGDTTDVYKYPNGTSSFGAYDMAGNVYEWVFDNYDAKYYAQKADNNPTGPNSSNPPNSKVVKGGSWFDRENYTRSSARLNLWFMNADDPGIGFRCALSAE